MLIASKRKLNLIPEGLQILINDTLIEQVKQKDVLGIIIDEELKWKEHINAQCKKLSSAVALLRRAKPFVSQNELVRMYNSLRRFSTKRNFSTESKFFERLLSSETTDNFHAKSARIFKRAEAKKKHGCCEQAIFFKSATVIVLEIMH
jgi:hypothetical protein